jgi:hypothetical protein
MPEYNRSMPGVLKSAIDHASRPYGQSAWEGKPAGVIGCSIGAIGTANSGYLRSIEFARLAGVCRRRRIKHGAGNGGTSATLPA